eukprot:TRINITY_DN12695_c0_g1_i1.p1 TRINITY_DN12695_c0_g1~~TRINITY_DN12695_c0_g1_i1.p1  ORF type:complete len:179 (-),score=73.31 TRINITY_DN12695_c0_g1_i1:45-581(-)
MRKYTLLLFALFSILSFTLVVGEEQLSAIWGKIAYNICNEKLEQRLKNGRTSVEDSLGICDTLQSAVEFTFEETGESIRPSFKSQENSDKVIDERATTDPWKGRLEKNINDIVELILDHLKKFKDEEEMKKLFHKRFFDWFTALLANKQVREVPEGVKKLFPKGAFDLLEKRQRERGY